jgi:hypothetical protein
LTVHLDTVATSGGEFDLDQALTVVVDHRRTDDGGVGTDANQRIAGHRSETAQRRQECEGLGQVGLSLSVVADHGRRSRRQIERPRHVVPEVHQLEMRHDHEDPRVSHEVDERPEAIIRRPLEHAAREAPATSQTEADLD